MSGQEDFTPLTEVLLACVGVMDVVSLFALAYQGPPSKSSFKKPSVDINNNDVRTVVHDKGPTISDARRSPTHKAIPMLVVEGDDVIDSLMSKVNELEAKVSELQVRSREASMERFLDNERYRRSRSPSPFTYSHYEDEDAVDGAGDEHSRTSLITRDDEFRKTIKRSSKGSSTHETREEELAKLTEIETEEMNHMNDFVPIRYSQHDEKDKDDDNYSHGPIDTIEEIATCPIHGDMNEEDTNEKKLQQEKQERQTRRSVSIEKQPVAQQIDVNENFIKMEKVALQQQRNSTSPSKMLVKQAHVGSEDVSEEMTSDLVVANEDIIEAKVAVESHREVAQASAPRVESFPKYNEILSEETSTIIPIEHATAKLIESELQQPIIRHEATIIKSPQNLETKHEEFSENTTEMPPTEHVPTVEIIDESSKSDLSLNAMASSSSSSLKENENQASAATENVEYLKQGLRQKKS